MIISCGGIKGGVGKTTTAINLTILKALQGRDVLLVDADSQETASDFTIQRSERLGSTSYTAVKLHGSAVRNETLGLAKKYDDVIIDVGGRDTAGQRAALTVSDIFIVPMAPSSFDVWTLEKVEELIEETLVYNETLISICFLNRADPRGADNEEAAEIARQLKYIRYVDTPLGNRKAFRNSAAQGLSVVEMTPKDQKAIAEVEALHKFIINLK